MANDVVDRSIEAADRMFEMFDRDAIVLARHQLETLNLEIDRRIWGVIYRHLAFLCRYEGLLRGGPEMHDHPIDLASSFAEKLADKFGADALQIASRQIANAPDSAIGLIWTEIFLKIRLINGLDTNAPDRDGLA